MKEILQPRSQKDFKCDLLLQGWSEYSANLVVKSDIVKYANRNMSEIFTHETNTGQTVRSFYIPAFHKHGRKTLKFVFTFVAYHDNLKFGIRSEDVNTYVRVMEEVNSPERINEIIESFLENFIKYLLKKRVVLREHNKPVRRIIR